MTFIRQADGWLAGSLGFAVYCSVGDHGLDKMICTRLGIQVAGLENVAEIGNLHAEAIGTVITA